jgi:hypothetical protein
LTALTEDGKEIHFHEAVGGKGIQNSFHLVALAIDLNLIMPNGALAQTTEDYRPLGTFWESLDPRCRWGGNYKTARPDSDHFELNAP